MRYVSAAALTDEELQERIRQTPKDLIAARIKEARLGKNYTHDYLGELCGGMYRQSLIGLEKGRNRPRPATLRLIAEHTERALEWFLGAEVAEDQRPFRGRRNGGADV